jgi:hypothetical protein
MDFSRLKLFDSVYLMSEPEKKGTVIEIKPGRYIRVRWPDDRFVSTYTFQNERLLDNGDLVMAALSF